MLNPLVGTFTNENHDIQRLASDPACRRSRRRAASAPPPLPPSESPRRRRWTWFAASPSVVAVGSFPLVNKPGTPAPGAPTAAGPGRSDVAAAPGGRGARQERQHRRLPQRWAGRRAISSPSGPSCRRQLMRRVHRRAARENRRPRPKSIRGSSSRRPAAGGQDRALLKTRRSISNVVGRCSQELFEAAGRHAGAGANTGARAADQGAIDSAKLQLTYARVTAPLGDASACNGRRQCGPRVGCQRYCGHRAGAADQWPRSPRQPAAC